MNREQRKRKAREMRESELMKESKRVHDEGIQCRNKREREQKDVRDILA